MIDLLLVLEIIRLHDLIVKPFTIDGGLHGNNIIAYLFYKKWLGNGWKKLDLIFKTPMEFFKNVKFFLSIVCMITLYIGYLGHS